MSSERAKPILAASIAAGLALTAWLVWRFGWRLVVASLGALGVDGFLLFCGYTLAVFVLLGWSWFVIAPGLSIRLLPAFVFGRLLREAAADTLPFAQLGGLLMGARATTLLGAAADVCVGSSIVDVGAEMAGQLLFTALGATIIALHPPSHFPHRLIDPVLWVGLAVGVATVVMFFFFQRIGLHLLDRFSARWTDGARGRLASLQDTLKQLYRRPSRPIASVVLHLGAWVAASGGVWLVLGLMDAPLSFPAVIALESLVYLLRSAAFFVPGAIGVLEGGYILLGPVFGVPPQVALSLALVKRGRDFAIGLPVVAIWQMLEGRRLMTPSVAAS